MDYVLGIDTSSVELGVGLALKDQPVMAVSRYLRHSHAEHIAQSIDYLLGANAAKADDIVCAGIAVGPGSFTGLRIGIAFLKGFFFGRDARVFPVSSLESMAGSWNARRARIVCASDARNGEVFWARFERTDDTISRLSPDALAPEDEFRNALDAGDVVITDTLGYGKSRAFAFLKERPNAFSVERCPLQRGLSCAMIAAKRIGDAAGWTTADRVLPRYLHAVSAEKKRTGQAG